MRQIIFEQEEKMTIDVNSVDISNGVLCMYDGELIGIVIVYRDNDMPIGYVLSRIDGIQHPNDIWFTTIKGIMKHYPLYQFYQL